MAVLLAWLQWRGECGESAWQRMLQAAAGRVRFPGQEARLAHGRIFRAPQRIGEGEGLLAGIRDAAATPGVWAVDGEVDAASGEAVELRMDGGPHASIWMAQAGPSLVLRRDVLGRRLLAYARVPGGVVVASGEGILTGHPEVSDALDEESMAACLALAAPAPGRSLFRDIRILEPGETLILSPDGERSQVLRLVPDPGWERLGDEEIVAVTRMRLRRAVERACAGARRVGILLSAGLDSCSVAAIAHDLGHRPIGFTHGFERFPDCDERAEVARWAGPAGIATQMFAVDDRGPLAGPDPPVCPDGPWTVAIREFRDLGHAAAAAAGVDVCLDGDFSDYLDAHPHDALADAVRFGRKRVLWQELSRILRQHGPGPLARHPAWRRLAARRLGRVGHHPVLIDLLAEPWKRRLRERVRAELAGFRDFPRPEHAYLCLRFHPALSAGREQFHAQRHGLEHRSPFCDGELARWMLSLPADLSYRQGHGKWLLRQSMSGLLPDTVRLRPKSYLLTPFLDTALASGRERLRELASLVRETWAPLMVPHRPHANVQLESLNLARIGAWMQASENNGMPAAIQVSARSN